MQISVCLPKGNVLKPLAKLFNDVSFPIRDYNSNNRSYRPAIDISLNDLSVRAKIMAEKDVVIQVAVGNYDIGFCGLDWIKEYTIKYKSSKIKILQTLGLDKRQIHVCCASSENVNIHNSMILINHPVTFVSEYPNICENFAIQKRIKNFKIFASWGSVESYPPENCDLVALSVYDEQDLEKINLKSICLELKSEVCLIANQESFCKKNLSCILDYFAKA